MSMRFSEALPRMEAGEIFEADDGLMYRIYAGELQSIEAQFADKYENDWERTGFNYGDLCELEFRELLPISNKAKELADKEYNADSCESRIPCPACLTVRKECNRDDVECPYLHTAYGMQVMLNWLAGHGVKEGA